MSIKVRSQELADKARALHKQERRMSLDSVALIGELQRINAAANLGLTSDKFLEYICLTSDQYWKRSQVARTIRFFPEVKTMLDLGETCLSHVTMAAAKITQANSRLILDGIRGKKRRAVEALLSRVTRDGRLLPREGEVEVRLKLKESEFAIVTRAREILAARGQNKTEQEVILQALAEMVERRDPMRKAERARDKAAQTAARRATVGAQVAQTSPASRQAAAEAQVDQHRTAARQERRQLPSRTPVPSALVQAVWLRDGRRCTQIHADGSRCSERAMLEVDHIVPWCRSGEHRLEDLRLLSRTHNRFAAEETLGHAFMTRYTEARLRDG